jgi:DNA-directed RNA polymerase specialized sigma24 family protein
MRVAYRILGSVSDAEGIMQDALVRWMKADRSEIPRSSDIRIDWLSARPQ